MHFGALLGRQVSHTHLAHYLWGAATALYPVTRRNTPSPFANINRMRSSSASWKLLHRCTSQCRYGALSQRLQNLSAIRVLTDADTHCGIGDHRLVSQQVYIPKNSVFLKHASDYL